MDTPGGDNAGDEARDIGGKVLGAIGEIGKTALSQITGHPQQPSQPTNTPTADDVANLKGQDEAFSKEAEAEVQAKIHAIYQEHRAKRLREQRQEQVVEQQEEVQKQQLEMGAKQEMKVNPAIDKTRAEIKNYGAE